MGWFKKKEENLLPDLPESLGELPKLPEIGDQGILDLKVSSLPSIPNSNLNNQQVIKNEIDNMKKSNFDPLPVSGAINIPKKIISEPSNIIKETPRTIELPNKTKGYSTPSTKKAGPIYIRLDKFKAGLESFEEIKDKVLEIEELLLKIRGIKEKEEAELEEWEREIQILKSRIEAIDNSVFSKLD